MLNTLGRIGFYLGCLAFCIACCCGVYMLLQHLTVMSSAYAFLFITGIALIVSRRSL